MACSPVLTKCLLSVLVGVVAAGCTPAADNGGGSTPGTGGHSGSSHTGGSGGSAQGGSQGSTGGTGGASGGAAGTGAGGQGSGGNGQGGQGGGGGTSAGGAGGTAGAAADTAGPETPAAPKLSTDVLPIVKMRCAVAGCHDPIKREHGMNLTTVDLVHAAWVNKTTADHCQNNMAVTRVVPMKPENSFVITLIEAQPGRCAEVRRMPPEPRMQMPAAEVKIIRDWVAAGANKD